MQAASAPTGAMNGNCMDQLLDVLHGVHAPALLNYGNMFTILPFGNATVVGKMTGAQILEVINYGPNVAGIIQPAGLKYKYFEYKDYQCAWSAGTASMPGALTMFSVLNKTIRSL